MPVYQTENSLKFARMRTCPRWLSEKVEQQNRKKKQSKTTKRLKKNVKIDEPNSQTIELAENKENSQTTSID